MYLSGMFLCVKHRSVNFNPFAVADADKPDPKQFMISRAGKQPSSRVSIQHRTLSFVQLTARNSVGFVWQNKRRN